MSVEDQLREALENAKETITEQQQLIEQLTAEPLSTGSVFQKLDDHVAILKDGKVLLCLPPIDIQLFVGDTVVLAQSGQILDSVPSLRSFGEIATVRAAKDEMLEVEIGGNISVAYFDNKKFEKVDKGDRVLIDKGVLVHNLGKEENRYRLAGSTKISWNDIGGLEHAKQALHEAIELPLQHPELYKAYNKRGQKGIMLYGPPGCGKTLLGKAAATAVEEIYKAKGDVESFMYVKGPELLEKYVGMAEQNIRGIFARARQFKADQGYPAVVFLDEADAILGKRGSGISSDMEKTIVPMFLAEMDGMEENGAIVILATNRADTLDPAIIREGRIDRKIGIQRPDKENSKQIFEVHLRDKPLISDKPVDLLAAQVTEHMFSQQAALFKILMKDEAGTVQSFHLGHIASGAMIEGIVDQATSLALYRDLAAGNDAGTGIHEEDLVKAVDLVAAQNRELDMKDAVKEHVEPFKSEVKKISKVV